jgi:hypothetical protein
MAKKIAIIGKDRICLADAPWSDYSWELWSLNCGYHECDYIFPRKDIKWFDLHLYEDIKKGCINYNCPIEEYEQFLRNKKDNCVINANLAQIFPEAQVFPIDRILNHYNTDFFRNSIALMIAYAIMVNPDLEELRVYGQTENEDPKYHDDEGCVQYWLGYAAAKGIKVNTSINSTMLKVKNGIIYGYKKTKEELNELYGSNSI